MSCESTVSQVVTFELVRAVRDGKPVLTAPENNSDGALAKELEEKLEDLAMELFPASFGYAFDGFATSPARMKSGSHVTTVQELVAVQLGNLAKVKDHFMSVIQENDENSDWVVQNIVAAIVPEADNVFKTATFNAWKHASFRSLLTHSGEAVEVDAVYFFANVNAPSAGVYTVVYYLAVGGYPPEAALELNGFQVYYDVSD